MLVFSVAVQAALPIVLLLWLWTRHPTGRGSWAAGVLLVVGVVAAVSLVVPWLYVPGLVRYVYLGTAMAGAVRSWFRIREPEANAAPGPFRRLAAWTLLLATTAAWTVAGFAVDGRRLPEGLRLDLVCPLGAGTYLVASGGSRLVVNPHLNTRGSDPRVLPWRGQSYGVDLVQVDGFGRRATRMASPNPAAYRIYGQTVLAPCAGVVVAAVDGRPDMAVPVRDPDPSHLPGNHVVLKCGDDEVLLGHLQPGSLRVAVEERVVIGDLLGFVGNSGNTDEPHLHISAQRRVDGQPAIGGDPVWITIGGEFLVRNDRIVCPSSREGGAEALR